MKIYTPKKVNKSFSLIPNCQTSANVLYALTLATFGLMVVFYGLFAPWLNSDPEMAYPASQGINAQTARIGLPKSTTLDPICGLTDVVCEGEETETMWRTVTAYNTVPEQTDGSPCIAANGTDICQGMAAGNHYVATNELEFGTKVKIAGTVYTVVDRTNSRYAHRYDIAYSANELAVAINFGVKTLPIEIIK